MRSDLYMITCAARTGSSLLETSLLSHPDIQSHGEVYHPNRVSALRGRYTALIQNEERNSALTRFRDKHQTAFLYKYVFDAQGKKAVGLKLKHEELFLPKFAETRETIRRDTDIKIIHLRRDNLFERYVSWYFATKVTRVTEIHSEEARPTFDMVEIPVKECHIDLDRSAARYVFFQKMYQHHPIFEVTYEELAGDQRNQTLEAIQRFLGVEPQELTSKLRKVVNKDLPSLVSNFSELAEYFSKTQHARFFEV
ncbi:sulfotransferase [Antarcticimicrobium luteum]|uniref:Sulfotransferase n=1 Tax=Antarcticimicrobium luteum TaxID=2547397 RepID=A0A4V3ASG6_9RHOB|nr:sulfotransferase [Antarcticimicrobium luteum]TDK50405.1 hypothetical protein E1832_06215 [Antarcticimicrobium luteum]